LFLFVTFLFLFVTFYTLFLLYNPRSKRLTPQPHTINKHNATTHHHTTPTGKRATAKQPEAHATRKGLHENVICYFFSKNAPPPVKEMLKPKNCKAKNHYRVSLECVDGGVVINFFGVGGVENFGIFCG
jgi:hypothetical protein